MDYQTVDADSFGRSLRGIGINLLVRDVLAEITFLETVFAMKGHQATWDFAIVSYGSQLFQLHRDGTYVENLLLGLLPENPPRGAGIEIRLYDADPDDAVARAEAAGFTILQPPPTSRMACARPISCVKTDMPGCRANPRGKGREFLPFPLFDGQSMLADNFDAERDR